MKRMTALGLAAVAAYLAWWAKYWNEWAAKAWEERGRTVATTRRNGMTLRYDVHGDLIEQRANAPVVTPMGGRMRSPME